MLDNIDKRYWETKSLKDILKDMKMDPDNIQQKRQSLIASQRFAEKLLNTIHNYILTIKDLKLIYHALWEFITDMENFYVEQKKIYQSSINKQQTKLTISNPYQENISIIKISLSHFEEKFNKIRDTLITTINFFNDAEDRHIHTKKINNFFNLFAYIYADIDAIIYDYEKHIK